MDISLSLSRFAEDWIKRLFGSLADAARSISYVETVNPTQVDTLHREIKRSNELQIKRAFQNCVKLVLRSLSFKRVKVAIDVTEDPYWGKHGYGNTRASAHNIGDNSWQWVNLAIVDPHFVPLMSLPYRQTEDLDELVIELLEYLRTLPLQVKLVLFDRGFYHWHLIDYLNNRRERRSWPYLIFVPQNKAIKKYIEQTEGKLGVFVHEGDYKKDKSKWRPKTKIVVLKGATKNKKGEPIDWCFATNQRAELQLVRTYRKRWNIETGFRIHDEAKIKTKSSNMLIRFFNHLVGMLFILIWRMKRLKQPRLSFKRQLKIIEMNFTEEKKPPPWNSWIQTFI